MIDSKNLCDSEFSIFVALEFDLHTPTIHYLPHFERILYLLDYGDANEYLVGKAPTFPLVE